MNLQSQAPAQFWKEKKINLPLKEMKSIPVQIKFGLFCEAPIHSSNNNQYLQT